MFRTLENSVNFVVIALMLVAISCNATINNVNAEDAGEQETESKNDGGALEGQVVENLTCDTYTWCTSLKSDATIPDFPSPQGGTISDGLYRLEQGAGIPHAIAFSGNSFTRILRSDFNLGGTFSTFENELTLNIASDCSKNGVNDYDNPFDSLYFYHVDGDHLYLAQLCDLEYCEKRWKFVRVENLCDNTSDYQCESEPCGCRFGVEEGFTGKDDSSESCEI